MPSPSSLFRHPMRRRDLLQAGSIGLMGLSMADAVQKMVDAKTAGVAMTVDPSNGDRSTIVIDAAMESLASGQTVAVAEHSKPAVYS